MRDKLKPPTDYSGNDPIRYYLYDIALSLRLLTAQKETPAGMTRYSPLDSAPETPMYTDKGCTCQACKPTMTPTYNYLQVPSEASKGEWYLHVDGRYYWRPDEG